MNSLIEKVSYLQQTLITSTEPVNIIDAVARPGLSVRGLRRVLISFFF